MKELLPDFIKNNDIDFVIANCENAAGGKGLTPKIADELFRLPVDVLTAGNHIWEVKSVYPYFDSHNIIRPLNLKQVMPGKGWAVYECKGQRIGVVSLQGEIFMDDKGPKAKNPFKVMDELLPSLVTESDISIIDFHAEATSEKRAMGFYLDGKVSALLGTHTHIQTADEEILPGGTAYISDLGMTGPHDSVIGLKKEIAIDRFISADDICGGKKGKFKVGEGGIRIEGVVLDIDEKARKVLNIRRIKVPLPNP